MTPHDDTPPCPDEPTSAPPPCTPHDLDSAYAAEPLTMASMARVEPIPSAELVPEVQAPTLSTESPFNWARLASVLLFAAIALLLVFVAPYIKAHWDSVDARSQAEAIYLARRAEERAQAEAFFEKREKLLKEEAAHAEKVLARFDQKLNLVSLGFREVARKVAPLVVNVQNLREPKGADLGPVARNSLVYDSEKDKQYVQAGVGSGLIVQPGVILTNYHVIKGGQRLHLTFASGRSIGIDKETIVADPMTDLAVIQLPKHLPAEVLAEADHNTPFANSDIDVQVGDWALAVGSPLGLKQTLTQGVISAKGRLLALLDMVELLQTDAAINPGNSGGPLFNQSGGLIGVNVAIASDNGGNQGIGFSIPSNTVRKIVDQLLSHGEVPRGYLGIGLDDVPGTRAKALAIEEGGVQVMQIIPGEAAHKAGLRVGDVIVKFNNEFLIKGMPSRHLRQMIVDTAPGTTVNLTLVRDGKMQILRVTIGKRPAILS